VFLCSVSFSAIQQNFYISFAKKKDIMAETSNYAISSLVLGILSIPFGFVFGIGIILAILGLIFGIKANKQIRVKKLKGTGMAIAGIVTSIVTLSLVLLIGGLAYFGVLTPMN
jgi:hypothetical protein